MPDPTVTPDHNPTPLERIHTTLGTLLGELQTVAATVGHAASADYQLVAKATEASIAAARAQLVKVLGGAVLTEAEKLELVVSTQLSRLTPIITALVQRELAAGSALAASEIASLAAKIAAGLAL